MRRGGDGTGKGLSPRYEGRSRPMGDEGFLLEGSNNRKVGVWYVGDVKEDMF